MELLDNGWGKADFQTDQEAYVMAGLYRRTTSRGSRLLNDRKDAHTLAVGKALTAPRLLDEGRGLNSDTMSEWTHNGE